MAKLTLSDLANLNNQTSAVNTINANSALIETAVENTLSRDGTLPNEMNADLDLNGFDLINVGNLFLDGDVIEADVVADFVDWNETSVPANPSANTARMYAVDEGGVTRLVYKDSSGNTNNMSVEPGDSLAITNLTQTGYTDLTEISEPSSPAANVARVYAIDDGGVTTVGHKDSAGNVVPWSHFKQTGTGAVTRTQHAKLRDMADFLDFIPVANHAAIKNHSIGSTDLTGYMQDATDAMYADNGGSIRLRAGTYPISSPGLVFDESALSTFLGMGRVNVVGDGSANTRIRVITPFTGAAINVIGNFASNKMCSLSGFQLAGNAGAAQSDYIGISVANTIFGTFRDIETFEFQYGFNTADVVGLYFENCRWMFNRFGWFGNGVFTSSPPNEIVFNKCHWIANQQYGFILDNGAPTVFTGGSFEGNGQAQNGGTGAASTRWQLRMDDAGHNGVTGIDLFGVHFENGGGQADIWINHDDRPCVYNIVACDFFRVVDTADNFTTNNITFGTTGATEALINVDGCGFSGVNSYVEDASRPYIAESGVTGTLHRWRPLASRNLFETAVAQPQINERHVLASGSLSGATVGITDIPTGYSELVLKVDGASCDTATRQMLLRVDTDNGASYDTTASNYQFTIVRTDTAAEAAKTLASLIETADQAAAATISATIHIRSYQGGGPNMCWNGFTFTSGDGIVRKFDGHYLGSTANIDAIQILWNGSGNFDAGTYTLYGIPAG